MGVPLGTGEEKGLSLSSGTPAAPSTLAPIPASASGQRLLETNHTLLWWPRSEIQTRLDTEGWAGLGLPRPASSNPL